MKKKSLNSFLSYEALCAYKITLTPKKEVFSDLAPNNFDFVTLLVAECVVRLFGNLKKAKRLNGYKFLIYGLPLMGLREAVSTDVRLDGTAITKI